VRVRGGGGGERGGSSKVGKEEKGVGGWCVISMGDIGDWGSGGRWDGEGPRPSRGKDNGTREKEVLV